MKGINASLEAEIWMMWQDKMLVTICRAAAVGQYNTALVRSTAQQRTAKYTKVHCMNIATHREKINFHSIVQGKQHSIN